MWILGQCARARVKVSRVPRLLSAEVYERELIFRSELEAKPQREFMCAPNTNNFSLSLPPSDTVLIYNVFH